MTTAAEILDSAYIYLHDDGTLWSRPELLAYLNDGYRRFLVESTAIRRLTAMTTPPRYRSSVSYPWERQYAPEPAWEWTWQDPARGGVACTYQWEIEENAGATPTASFMACTHPWERIYVGSSTDRTDRYPYPDDHLRAYRISFNGLRKFAGSTQTVDEFTTNWETLAGTPDRYLSGLGRKKSFQLYPAASSDGQQMALRGGFLGTIRSISGSLTYSFPDGAYGVVRAGIGTRQYYTGDDPPVGTVRDWTSSTANILMDSAIVPPTLAESDAPDLLPKQFAKYLRYFILSRAFGRSGEGANAALASHFEARWRMGLQFLKRIGRFASVAKVYQQQRALQAQRRPAKVRLPAEYPRIR